jgi:arylsulfatase A-like enzyme
MLYKLDESVGRIISSLDKHGMLADSIIVFTTDNGGPAAGFNQNAASNWPLRGVKSDLKTHVITSCISKLLQLFRLKTPCGREG